MFQLVLGIHLLLCVILIGLVLLQQGKGADAGAVLGGSSNTLFGAGGATSLMVKVTTAIAVSFMVTSIFLVRGYAALLESEPAGVQVTDPGLAEPMAVDAEAVKVAPEAGAPAAAPVAGGVNAEAANAQDSKQDTKSETSQATSAAAGGSSAGAAAPAAEPKK